LIPVDIDGTVVIGGRRNGPRSYAVYREKVGTGQGPRVDVAVDPLEGTTVLSKGVPRSMTVIAVAEEGCLFHAPDMYMDKLAVGPKARGAIDIDLPIESKPE